MVDRKIDIGVAKDDIAQITILVFHIFFILLYNDNKTAEIRNIIKANMVKSLRLSLTCTKIGIYRGKDNNDAIRKAQIAMLKNLNALYVVLFSIMS